MRILILSLIAPLWWMAMADAQAQSLSGGWNVEVTFANGEHHSLRFDAQSAGKGTLSLTDPQAKVWGAGKASQATWTQAAASSVTFSGPVEFLLGNVGREAGTLVFKGKFETPNMITGQADFSSQVGGRAKHGKFRATRAGK
jgi:hypothetical protein